MNSEVMDDYLNEVIGSKPIHILYSAGERIVSWYIFNLAGRFEITWYSSDSKIIITDYHYYPEVNEVGKYNISINDPNFREIIQGL